jgi:hypothetical protein
VIRRAWKQRGVRGTIQARQSCPSSPEAFAMRVFLGMILGALLLIAGVYAYDSQTTSTVANGENASNSRTIVNWDVAATDWNALKQQAHNDWIRLSSR